ncbi:MAG TPA: hypothetical protein VG013_39230 [Gemmataceae bacterium]|jgi:hypothetical protein|nr:hypothetical protein [Gemmataceae bacterium]
MFEAKRLIGALASHNPAPKLVGDEMEKQPDFAKKFDWTDQARVHKAITELTAHAEQAWPDLLDSLDDKRYAITYMIFDSGYNLDVGDVCREIILDWLAAGYVPHVPPATRKGVQAKVMRTAVVGYEKVKGWCLHRKGKKLYELQIEICENSIGWIQGITDAPAEERRASIRAIRAQIKSLHADKKPRAPERFLAGEYAKLYGPR